MPSLVTLLKDMEIPGEQTVDDVWEYHSQNRHRLEGIILVRLDAAGAITHYLGDDGQVHAFGNQAEPEYPKYWRRRTAAEKRQNRLTNHKHEGGDWQFAAYMHQVEYSEGDSPSEKDKGLVKGNRWPGSPRQ